MEINLDYNNIDFKDKIINLPKGVKIVNIYGDNINISTLCDILENVKNNIEIRKKYLGLIYKILLLKILLSY